MSFVLSFLLFRDQLCIDIIFQVCYYYYYYIDLIFVFLIGVNSNGLLALRAPHSEPPSSFKCLKSECLSSPLSPLWIHLLCMDVLCCQVEMPVITSQFNRVILFFFSPLCLPHTRTRSPTHTHTQLNYRWSQVYLFCPFSCYCVGKCLALIYSTLSSDWITLMGTSITEHDTRKILTKHLRSHYNLWCSDGLPK